MDRDLYVRHFHKEIDNFLLKINNNCKLLNIEIYKYPTHWTLVLVYDKNLFINENIVKVLGKTYFERCYLLNPFNQVITNVGVDQNYTNITCFLENRYKTEII